MKKAVLLLSGGLDSATVLALMRRDGYEIYALSVDYQQRHQAELKAAAELAAWAKVKAHQIVKLDLRMFGGSALTSAIDVPKDRPTTNDDIPITYVPARNTIFLSLALAWAEVLGAWDIFIGANAVDFSGYPDCRPEFLRAFEDLANRATKAAAQGEGKFKVHAPLVEMTKKEIIQLGLSLGVDYELTRSCYDPDGEGKACGRCDACQIRQQAFRELGL